MYTTLKKSTSNGLEYDQSPITNLKRMSYVLFIFHAYLLFLFLRENMHFFRTTKRSVYAKLQAVGLLFHPCWALSDHIRVGLRGLGRA
jgi:hypothetical protein